ncbi:MAG: gluconokinase [Thermodesulfobacteriota bacterium]
MTRNKTARPVLAVDIGTSSVRVLAFDVEGTVLGRRQIAYETLRPRPFFEEQDPDLVRNEVYRAMRDILTSGEIAPGAIDAIAFSSQMYGVFALDGEGEPLTNNILWSDGRAEPQADAIKAANGALWLYPETGCPMNSIYPLAKLAWLRKTEPEIFAAARRFVSIKEYVTAPLVGEWVVDYSMASATGMFDIRAHAWHSRALAAAGIRVDQLSRPVSGLHRFRVKPDSPLSSLGLRDDVAVFPGGGDGPLANLGSGASGVGAINIDLGTSGAARCITDSATVDDDASLWCFCLTDRLWAYGGILTNVGNAYQWLGSNVLGAAGLGSDEAYALLNRLAAEAEPGAGGLFFLPYLRKARSPYWDGRLKGVIYGLNADHGMPHIARALLEAIAYDLKSIVDLIDKRIVTVPHIILTGGLSRSQVLPQLLADVLGREIRTSEEGEGSVAGAAILALQGIGAIEDLAFSAGGSPCASFTPDQGLHTEYRSLHGSYSRLVGAMRESVFSEGELR